MMGLYLLCCCISRLHNAVMHSQQLPLGSSLLASALPYNPMSAC